MKKKHDEILSIVTTIITFGFFLGFVYFSYFTAKELLIEKVISTQEYTQKFYEWEYKECQNPYSYVHQEMVGFPEVSFSDEIRLGKLPFPDKVEKIQVDNRKKIERCESILYNRSNARKHFDFERNLSKYGLAMFFFLILFLGFTLQSVMIYRKK